MDQPDHRQTGRFWQQGSCWTGAVLQLSQTGLFGIKFHVKWASFSYVLTWCFCLFTAGVPPGPLQQQERPEGRCEEDGLHGEGNHDRPGSPPSDRQQLQRRSGCPAWSHQGGHCLHWWTQSGLHRRCCQEGQGARWEGEERLHLLW